MFHPATLRWFETHLGAPTPVQARGWPALARGDHALLVAPTGSGKTLAAFLVALDRLLARPPGPGGGVRVVYVSPLKALAYDVERNLATPLAGIRAAAAAMGRSVAEVGVAVRTGDTPTRERARFARDPADILVTTPESLFLMVGSGVREALRGVETVIVDEIHALAPTKRGAHLALTLERLDALAGRPVQRVGLSATVRPVEAVAAYLGGDRPVTVIDAADRPRLDLSVEAWLPALADDGALDAADARRAAPAAVPEATFPLDRGGWTAQHQRMLALVRAARSTLLFTNSRRLCERLALRLNELAGEELCRAHHGSLAAEQRAEIERQLKDGRLRALVATGTMELGVDMAYVDQVLLVESPGSAARGLQRVGRAGHQVGGRSRGVIFPRHRADLVECAVVARDMLRGEIEALAVPRNPLDVLAQQVVAMVADADTDADRLYALVRRAAPWSALPRAAFDGVLGLLAGRYPSGALADLSARIVWEPDTGRLRARRGAGTLTRLNAGAIPDRGLYGVFLGEGGPRVGELDEEMVFESRVGDVVQLGASTWRIEAITRDRVQVRPAPGETGRMPFWRGAGAGRPAEVGQKLGAFLRALEERSPEESEALLVAEHALDPRGARQLLDVLAEQRAATGALPTDRCVVVERFPDETGDTRLCLLSPFGARVHGAWAMALQALLSRRGGAVPQALYGDDGVVVRVAAGEAEPGPEALVPAPEMVEELVLERLVDTPLFAACFRENAARALLLPRNRPGRRTPLWAQRLRAQNLLATVREWPDFPILVETVRECLRDVLDLDGFVRVLEGLRGGEVRLHVADTREASPFARALVWRWTNEWLYELDGPAAERRAAALHVDRTLLRELIGEADWLVALDPAVFPEVEAELQGTAEGWQAPDRDTLHDVLRRVGDLDGEEIDARCAGDGRAWARALAREGRAVRVEVAGATRWAAAEDGPLLARVADDPDAFAALARRYARTHAPFGAAALAARFGLPVGPVAAALDGLAARGALTRGRFHPEAGGLEWAEPAVLQRLRRRSQERAKQAVEARDAPAYARMLARWQGVGLPGPGLARLREVVASLEGCPLPFGDLEAAVLPARVPGYRPAMLDELGAMGEVVWVGHRPLGDADGRIALYRRDRVGLLVDPPAPGAVGALERALLDHLDARGATFLAELRAAAAEPLDAVLEALWGLAWRGLVTNDTFGPLRAMATTRARRGALAAGGRWSTVARLVGEGEATRRAWARGEALLRRYGVVGVEAARHEEVPGGGAGVYPVWRALEEAGRARRGWFVEGLGGAQFAAPGAVEALRADAAGGVVVLAATDPANPYGALLAAPMPGLRRAAGARVVLVEGALAAFVERSGRSLRFGPVEEGARRAALAALAQAARQGGRPLRLETVDGQPALGEPWAGWLRAAGFGMTPRGWEAG